MNLLKALPKEELGGFFLDFPYLLEAWYYGVAMGKKYNVQENIRRVKNTKHSYGI